ncbi:MAG: ABC-2 transporter permease [Clostridiales bacterium]|jgi:hypothetical protein|nr:ABC-2 transporter permease [Clostridiales bacterium]
MSKLWNIAMLDFRTIKTYFAPKNWIFFAIIMLLSSSASGGSTAIFVGMFLAYFYASYPFAIGEKTNMDALYCTLGISREELVGGRYLFTVIMLLIGSAFSLFIAIFVSIFMQQPINLGEKILIAIFSSLIMFVLLCVQLPVHFKMQYTKSRTLSFIPLFIVSASISIIGTMWGVEGIVAFIEWAGSFEYSALYTLLASIFAFFATICISYFVSVGYYKKREF